MTLFLNHELARKIEMDVVEGYKQIAEVWNAAGFGTRVKTLQIDDALAIYGDSEFPINETVGLGMAAPVNASTLEELERFYDSNNHPAVVRVCPMAHPSLVEATQQRGYVLNDFSYRWVLDLNSWESPFDEVDSRVRRATPDEEIAWASAVCAGFEDLDNVRDYQSLDLNRAFFRMQSGIPVVACENGEIAAGGLLALSHGIAALFATSTRPSYRRRGLQTALLDWRLRFAKENGALIATVETDPDTDSQRNVERMGFRLAYVTAELIKPVGV